MDKTRFISTTDPEVAEQLKSLGLIPIGDSSDGVFTFVNVDGLSFSSIPHKKVVFSNTLCV